MTTIRTLFLAVAVALASSPVPTLARAKVAAPTTCDRECLKSLADSYIASLVAHDPAKVPLAQDVKIVENAHRIKPGEGLWKTTTAGPAEFKIVVPDP